MVRKKGVRVVVLAEDQALVRFARNALMTLGFSGHEIRLREYSVGKNAKQWVTRNYPEEVRAHRRQARHQQVALLVGTDADEQTVAQRRGALEHALAEAGIDRREDHERIVLWIPKRHIETWLLFLAGQDVTEDENCKHRVRDPDFVAAGRSFVDLLRRVRREPATDALPSLRTAFEETRRMDE
jgi:hypothetical protein